MAGLYIHIPFCSRKCHYCNFFSVASERLRTGFANALAKELKLQKDFLGGDELTSVYFGGGTPTMLDKSEVGLIFSAISKHYTIREGLEITIEANPEDVTVEGLLFYKELGVNRISLGVQSFRDEDLVVLNRTHGRKEVLRAIETIQGNGFSNVSIDLMYGIPGLSDRHWESNLQEFAATGVNHLSAYALTLEPGTALDVLIKRGKSEIPDEAIAARQFDILMDFMESEGFEHYEISNFARGGAYSRHNMGYWTGDKYLGAGPSAHSYDLVRRQWNIHSVSGYINYLNDGMIPAEYEILTADQKYNEFVMTSLRTCQGVSLKKMADCCGKSYSEHFSRESLKHIHRGHAYMDDNRFLLTKMGKHFADSIAADLFI